MLSFDMVRFYTLKSESVGFNTLQSFLTSTPLVIEQILLPLMMLCVYAVSGYYNLPFQKSRLQEFFATALNSGVNTILIFFRLAHQPADIGAFHQLHDVAMPVQHTARRDISGPMVYHKLDSAQVPQRQKRLQRASLRTQAVGRKNGVKYNCQ